MQKGSRTNWARCISCVLLVALSGCTLGAGALRSNRPAYNQAIHSTEKEELLLNILRIRYAEPVKFLQVASIVSSFQYSAGINGNATVPINEPELANGPNILNLGTGLNYAEAPTVTYVPLEGTQFATQMLTQPTVGVLALLLESGWPVDLITLLLIERIGALENSDDEFKQMVELLTNIQARGDLSLKQIYRQPAILAPELPARSANPALFGGREGSLFFMQPLDTGNFRLFYTLGPVTVIELTYASEEEARQMTALLGVKSSRPAGTLVENIRIVDSLAIPFQPDVYVSPVTEIPVHLRSMIDQMTYLSEGVKVPASDQDIAVPPGHPQSLLSVEHSNSRPGDAYVSVKHNDTWFSVKKDDLQSKSTLALLLTILSLQTASAGNAPALTLPVGG